MVGWNLLVAQVLARVLDQALGVEVLGVFAWHESVFEAICTGCPDLVLMDGLDHREMRSLCRRLRQELRVVAYGLDDDERQIVTAIEAGASGYLLKRTPIAKIRTTLMEVLEGGTVCSSAVLSRVARRMARLSQRQPRPVEVCLTRREKEVLDLVGRGLTNQQIALRLEISESTVKNHVYKICRKFDCRSRREILRRAHRVGLQRELPVLDARP